MARLREFDTDVAVQQVMEVFWRQGFEATSVEDLVAATGIGRGSLYAAFGSKHGLYERALQHYVRQTTDEIRQALMRRTGIRQALRELLLGRVDNALADPGRPGCLLVTAITERLPHDPATRRIASDALTALQESVSAALHVARSLGELPPDTDVAALAAFLVIMIQGLRVVGAAHTDRAALEKAIDVALQAIPENGHGLS
jgi:TetR/AcrR family transcriptional repressor of nem operon